MANKDTAKQWFETGDYPTQSQFSQVFEWLRWKDEPQPISTITGLQNILNTLAASSLNRPEEVVTSSNFEFIIPEKYRLENLAIKNNSAVPMSLSFNIVPTGVVELFHVDIEAYGAVDVDDFAETQWADLTIAVTGITNSLTFLIDRR